MSNSNDSVGHPCCGLAGSRTGEDFKEGPTRAAIAETRRRGEGLAISDITLLEIAAIENKGWIKLSASLEAFLAEIEARFIVLPMTGRICVGALGFPAAYPKDPRRPSHRSNRTCRGTSSDYGR